MKKIEFVEQANKWGVEKIPFFFLINFDATQFEVIQLEDLDRHGIYLDFPNYRNTDSFPLETTHLDQFIPHPISYKDYKEGFDLVMSHIQQGNTYLTNLTYPTRLETNSSLSELFHLGKAKYRLAFRDEFICFSPESFVTISDDNIRSYPMKGTISADIPNAKTQILQDKKETAEHATIVDLIRNDLAMVSKNVRVTNYRYLDLIKTNRADLWQVSSEITGDLNHNWRAEIGDLLLKLMPAGSISGAPKPKTMSIIQEAEKSKRGWFTGISGIFYGDRLDSCVNIRFIEAGSDGHLWFRSGGGITSFSLPESEYDELIAKVYVPTTRVTSYT